MARGFSVFVSIGGKVSPTLGAAVRATESQIGKLTRGVKLRAAETRVALKEMTAAVGPLASMAAAGGLSLGLKGIFGEGAEWQHQIAMMRMAGRTSTEVAATTAAAWRTVGQVPTATLNDSLKTIGETTLAFGGLKHALENLTFNEKMGGLLKNVLGDDFDQGAAFNQLVRALELRSGKMSPATYQRQANALFKAMVVSHGTVNPENILGFAQQAGLAMRGYSESFLASVVPSLIQEMGGERAGTAATAMFNQFMGRTAVGGKSITQEWVRLGLVPAKGTGGNLSTTGWTPGTLKGNGLAMSDPLAWFEKVLFPALRAHGVDTSNRDQMLLQMQKMFGRETGKRLASTFGDPRQLARIHADMALYGRAQGVNAAYKSGLKNDPKMAQQSLSASFKNMETALGKAATPVLVPILNGLTTAFSKLAGVFDRHPNFARAVVGLMGLGLVSATLKTLGLSARWAFSPISGLWRLLFSSVGGAGPRIPWLTRNGGMFRGLGRLVAPALRGLGRFALSGLRALGPFFMAGLRAIGPFFLRGLGALGPFVLRGVVMAFGLLSNPVGWAFLAVTAAVAAGVLIYKFRGSIGPALTRAWGAIKSAFTSLDWKGIGWAIADFLTFGLASKLPGAIASLRTKLPTALGGAAVAGKRALGGPVLGGRMYLVGEHGPELFRAPGSGAIVPARQTARILAPRDRRDAGRAGGGQGHTTHNWNINGITDPQAVAAAVDQRLRHHARQQSLLYSD